jgi:hypothetical protein
MQDASILRALTEKYAELLGELRAADERAAATRESIAHLDHVIRLYRKDWTGDGVKPRRPSYPSRYLKVGHGITTALDVLREAQRPLTVREIVLAVIARLAIPSSPGAIKSLESSVRYCLAKRVGHELIEVSRDPLRFAVSP